MIDLEFIENNVTWTRPDPTDGHIMFQHYNTAKIQKSILDEQPSTMREPLIDKLIHVFGQHTDMPDDWDFLSVQRYDAGDCMPPHEDGFQWHRLLILTTSPVDGLVLADADKQKYIFYPDQAGNIINIPSMTTHWVNPVTRGPRYTAVIGSMN